MAESDSDARSSARTSAKSSASSSNGESFGLAAARVLEARSAEVFNHARGVLDITDIERVHDMRVATRRLRAVLEVYRPCFPKGRLKATLSDVKDLTRALGERRDRDVSILALEEFVVEVAPEDRTGIEKLIRRLRDEQEAANRALAQAVHGRRLQALRVRLEDLAVEARRRVDGESEADPTGTADRTGSPERATAAGSGTEKTS